MPGTSDTVNVVLLRSGDGPGDRYVSVFNDHGVRAVCEPALRFRFPHQKHLTDRLRTASSFSALVLTSPRAARAVKDVFERERSLKRLWASRPVFVVGPKTSDAVASIGLTPRGGDSGQAAALVDRISTWWHQEAQRDSPVLFASGNRRRDTIPHGLARAGIPVAEQQVYETVVRTDVELPALVDWLVLFSPSGILALEASGIDPGGYRLAAIGPTTAQALKERGHFVQAVASTPTPERLVRAIRHASGGDPSPSPGSSDPA